MNDSNVNRRRNICTNYITTNEAVLYNVKVCMAKWPSITARYCRYPLTLTDISTYIEIKKVNKILLWIEMKVCSLWYPNTLFRNCYLHQFSHFPQLLHFKFFTQLGFWIITPLSKTFNSHNKLITIQSILLFQIFFPCV